MANYDILGDIAIVKFNEDISQEQKISKAHELLQNKSIKTVLEKANKVSGRLRTIKTNFLLGENKKETIYKESSCLFKLNVESCYFSPRLANERLEVAKLVSKKKNSNVLVMFAGVSPFSIVIAKNSHAKKIISVELGKECNKYARENVLKNKVGDRVEIMQGDVNRVVPKLDEKFDFIIMPRPNLKDSFLKSALSCAKKGTIIVYYGFSPESKKDDMIECLIKEAKKLKRKIKILKVLEAGDIAPYEHRYRVEIKVL